MKRTMQILETENITVSNPNLVAELIMRHAPDWRRVLNEIQRHSRGGELQLDVLSKASSSSITDLFSYLKKKDFREMRKWVANNMDVESAAIFRGVYDSMDGAVATNSIPQLVLILADYQYKSAFVADAELNMVACLTEIMAQVEFK